MICFHTLIYCVLYSMIQFFYKKISCAEYRKFLERGEKEGEKETLVDCKNFVNGFI